MEPNRESGPIRLIACPHLLSIEKDRIDVLRPAGGSVTDLLRSIGWTRDQLSARVMIDGEFIKDAAWEYTMPCAGQSMVVRAIPMGGGGEGQGKEVMRIVMQIAVIVASMAATAMTGNPMAGMAVMMLGTLAVTARIPPARPRLRDQRKESYV